MISYIASRMEYFSSNAALRLMRVIERYFELCSELGIKFLEPMFPTTQDSTFEYSVLQG